MGIALSFWAGVGAFIYPALDINTRPLSLSIEGCLQPNSSDPTTSVPPSYLDPTALPSRYSIVSVTRAMFSLGENVVKKGFNGKMESVLLLDKFRLCLTLFKIFKKRFLPAEHNPHLLSYDALNVSCYVQFSIYTHLSLILM